MPAMVTCSVGSQAEKAHNKLGDKSSKKLAPKNLAGRSSQEMQESDALPLQSAAPPSDATLHLLIV